MSSYLQGKQDIQEDQAVLIKFKRGDLRKLKSYIDQSSYYLKLNNDEQKTKKNSMRELKTYTFNN